MTAPYRTSPAYESHVSASAKFKNKNGWRRVDYFACNETAALESWRPRGEEGQTWSTAVVAEHQAVRNTVGLFDLSSFGKVEVHGPGAMKLMDWVSANDVSRGPGQLTYTQWLNETGGVVADVTVGQLLDDGYFVVTGTGAMPHDLNWLQAQLANPASGIDEPAVLSDVTGSWACFGVWGPEARDVLQSLVDCPLDSTNFPYMRMRETNAQGVAIRLSRVTFVGELGWEIYVPSDYGRWLWEELLVLIEEHDGRRCGYQAIDSLRVEKGYLYLGADLLGDRTPFESGVDSFVRLGKNFLGRDAVDAAKNPVERLTCIRLSESGIPLRGGEQVSNSDGPLGKITSGGTSYTLNASIGFAYLPAALPLGSEVSVAVGATQLKGLTVDQPQYDPNGQRIRA
ncbi:MAG: aminomethyltransferase family protein [Actinomycetes bacterium]